MPTRATKSAINATRRGMSKAYNDALAGAIKKSRDYWRIVSDVENGRIKPPASYKTQAQIDGWKQSYLRRALRNQNVVNTIAAEMNAAGVKNRKSIESLLRNVYGIESGNVNKILGGLLDQKTQRQISALLSRKQTAFSRISLNHLGGDRTAVRRLQRELAAGIARGESRDKLIERVRRVTGMSMNDAQRVLRTESTRVAGEAQVDEAMEYYERTGIMPRKKWICTFRNSRDTHKAIHGKIVNADEDFAENLAFPGDPRAPASETVNCQCYIEILGAE